MKHQWHFMINQFLVATRNNYKKALKLSTEHDNRVKKRLDDNPGDADYILIYNRYHPLHVSLNEAYTLWKSKGGIQKGDTLTVNQLLKLLPKRINLFDRKIQDVHEEGSPRYVQLFPRGHKPFYRGSYENRLAALEALSRAIGSEAALASIKAMVDALIADLNLAKEEQTGLKSEKSTSSTEVEYARIEAMTCQYQDVGVLINKFPNEPGLIESLFDVSTLTNPEQVIWKGHLDAGEKNPLLIRTFTSGDEIRIKSIGEGDIGLFLASFPGGTDSKEVSVGYNHALKFYVDLFGVSDFSTHRYLTIINKNKTSPTRFFLQLY
jgi:hypothetical protein